MIQVLLNDHHPFILDILAVPLRVRNGLDSKHELGEVEYHNQRNILKRTRGAPITGKSDLDMVVYAWVEWSRRTLWNLRVSP